MNSSQGPLKVERISFRLCFLHTIMTYINQINNQMQKEKLNMLKLNRKLESKTKLKNSNINKSININSSYDEIVQVTKCHFP